MRRACTNSGGCVSSRLTVLRAARDGLGRVLASFQPAAPRIITTQQLVEAMRGGSTTSSGASVTAETAVGVAAVYACARILSDSVGMLPTYVYRRDGDRDVLDGEHPLHLILNRRANAWLTGFEFKRWVMWSLCYRGNAYAYILRDSRGVPAGLWPLAADAIEPSQDADTKGVSYRHKLSSGAVVVYAAKDVLHVRAQSWSGLEGVSPVRAGAEAIGLAIQTERHAGKMFAQGTKPSGALKVAKPLSDEAFKRLKAQFDDQYSGTDNAHRTILLEDGMEWQQMGLSSTDSQLIESRKFQRSEIAMFFGVPPHMLGDVEKTTSWGSGIEQQGIGFVTYTLRPWLVNLAQSLERDLLGDDTSRSIRFETDELTRPGFLDRQNGLAIMRRAGVINANEWRAREGMNPRADAGGDDYIVESNMQPATDGLTTDG